VLNTDLRAPAGLANVVTPAAALTTQDDHLLPVVAALQPLLPDGGLRRGSTVNVQGVGATSLALALLTEPNATGAWCAAVGVGSLGLLAADRTGLTLSRLVLVAEPGRDWPAIVAALLDAFEIVLLQPPSHSNAGLLRRLVARVRERDRVLVTLGDESAGLSCDVRLVGTAGVWEGLGWGSGHLRSRQLEVRAEGRRLAGRARHATVWLPDQEGRVTSTVTHITSRPALVEKSA
jgi:hypothetical protein